MIKTKRAVWLAVAFLCIVCSGAIKKLIQLNADKRSGIIYDLTTAKSLSQNIKDGHRERHEYQSPVVQEHKRQPLPGGSPFFDLPSIHSYRLLLSFSVTNASLSRRGNARTPFVCPLPLYLRFRNLEI
jgi:hypothetical protein